MVAKLIRIQLWDSRDCGALSLLRRRTEWALARLQDSKWPRAGTLKLRKRPRRNRSSSLTRVLASLHSSASALAWIPHFFLRSQSSQTPRLWHARMQNRKNEVSWEESAPSMSLKKHWVSRNKSVQIKELLGSKVKSSSLCTLTTATLRSHLASAPRLRTMANRSLRPMKTFWPSSSNRLLAWLGVCGVASEMPTRNRISLLKRAKKFKNLSYRLNPSSQLIPWSPQLTVRKTHSSRRLLHSRRNSSRLTTHPRARTLVHLEDPLLDAQLCAKSFPHPYSLWKDSLRASRLTSIYMMKETSHSSIRLPRSVKWSLKTSSSRHWTMMWWQTTRWSPAPTNCWRERSRSRSNSSTVDSTSPISAILSCDLKSLRAIITSCLNR